MAGHGGKRNGAGRKPKASEEHARAQIIKALRLVYDNDKDEDNIVSFLKEFSQTNRGQQFIAEHLLGKPKEVVEAFVENVNIPISDWA